MGDDDESSTRESLFLPISIIRTIGMDGRVFRIRQAKSLVSIIRAAFPESRRWMCTSRIGHRDWTWHVQIYVASCRLGRASTQLTVRPVHLDLLDRCYTLRINLAQPSVSPLSLFRVTDGICEQVR